MLISTQGILAIVIALGTSITLITTSAIRNARLYKDNANLRRAIKHLKDIRHQTIYSPWEINPDHEYESRHTAK